MDAASSRAAGAEPFGVLIMDDSRTSALSIRRLLAQDAAGRLVVGAASAQALDAVSGAIHVVVLDLDAAPGDEPARADLCRRLGARWPGARIIGLAREALLWPEARLRQLGVDHRLGKPVDGAALRALVAPVGRAVETPRHMLERVHQAMAQQPPLLDLSALRALQALGGAAFVSDVVLQFLGESQGLLAALHEAVQANDARAFASHIHALRSSAANVGAGGIYRLCLSWREMSQDEIESDGAQRLRLLERQFAQTRQLLLDHLARLAAPPAARAC